LRIPPSSVIIVFAYWKGWKAMELDISKIKTAQGQTRSWTLEGTVPDTGEGTGRITFQGPVQVDLQVENLAGNLLLKGTARGRVRQNCDRCLEPYTEEFSVVLEEVIYPESRPPGDELDFYRTYQGNFLDLDGIIQDAVVVANPITRLCSPQCRGICSRCGKNLNSGPCGCAEDVYNPRMEVLRKLLKEE